MWRKGGNPILLVVSVLRLTLNSILGGKPNSFYLVPELLEEILLRLPLKSVLRFRSVSKQWKSILESKVFLERRMRLQKSRRKLLGGYYCDCRRRPRLLPESIFEGDEEEIVSLHCSLKAEKAPLTTCDGLVCFAEKKWINVLNPSTRQRRRFPSGLSRMWTPCSDEFETVSRGSWAIGLGRDKARGSYKVVTIHFWVSEYRLLDVETGEWRKLSRPPRPITNVGIKSACANGSIYWIGIGGVQDCELLALDLDEEKFHVVVSVPEKWITLETRVVNLEDRLAMAKTKEVGPEWILEILSMDADEETWTKTYSISLTNRVVDPKRSPRWFTPVAVSKRGNLVFYDNQKRLFKYYPVTDEIRCLSLRTRVISLYVENLVPLPLNGSPDPDLLKSYDWGVFNCPLISTEAAWNLKVLLPKFVFLLCLICLSSEAVLRLLWLFLVWGCCICFGFILCGGVAFALALSYVLDGIPRRVY